MTRTSIVFIICTAVVGSFVYFAFDFVARGKHAHVGPDQNTGSMAALRSTDNVVKPESQFVAEHVVDVSKYSVAPDKLHVDSDNSSDPDSGSIQHDEVSKQTASEEAVAGEDGATGVVGEEIASIMSLVERAAAEGENYNLHQYVDEFTSLLTNSVDLSEKVLQLYGPLPDGLNKEVLHSLLVVASNRVNLEQPLVDLVVSGAAYDQPDIYALVEDVGVRSTSTRQHLLEALPTMTGESGIGSAIRSIVPQIVPSEERRKVIGELSPFLSHPDALIRGAAVRTVGEWGNDSHAPVIEQGLTDSSLDVRHAAAAAALRSSIRSDTIKSSLLAMMTNPNEHIDARQQAHFALTNYALDGHDYDNYYEFNQFLEGSDGHNHSHGDHNHGLGNDVGHDHNNGEGHNHDKGESQNG